MSEPYLIAHKVRGEPAFDVAVKLTIGNEDGWIIPTSGHRAYPYGWVRLTDVERGISLEDFSEPIDWEHIPDHYAANDQKISTVKGPKDTITHIDLEELGL